ncbi:MAG TPA: FHA domain-containing protein, partial [Pirellulales bacterium]|nr:FHA domain-containing protein [Pirellulales bacterium]
RLRRQLTLLGRESPSTRRLNHPSISRVHCAVFWDGQELWLVDFFSSNGTRLAGTRFDSGRLLAGQEFKLGSVRIIYLGTKNIDASDGSALDQPVGILEHNDDAEGNDSGLRLAETEARSSALATLQAVRDEHFSSIEQRLEALRQQCERFERERDEFQQQLLQEREANQERLVAIREELAKEVTALQHGSESAAREFQRLSSEVATTREELFARYADAGPKSAEEAGRADDERLQIANALQNAETRWMELAQDLSRRTLELQRQLAESQEAHHLLAGSIRLEREQMQRRLRAERRAYSRRLAHAKRELAAELAGLHEESTAVRHDLQSIEAAMVRVQPTSAPGGAEAASAPGEPHCETVKRHEETLLLAESQRKELSEAIERRATGLAQQIADCRQADLEMAESFKKASRETGRQLASQQQAQSRHIGAVKDELLAGHATLRDEIVALQEGHAADFASLQHTLAAVQPTLARLESGEWLAELERRWQARLQATTNEASQQIADLRRQSSLDGQAASDRVAVLEGALVAKIADVRCGLDLLREAREQQDGALRDSSVANDTTRGETDSQPAVGPSSLPGRRETEISLVGETADTDSLQPSETYEDAEGAGAPDWVISDQVTQRLIDFKTNRDPTARRRLLWSAVAAALVAIIVSGAGIIRLWLNGSEEPKSSEAASLPQSRLVNP